MVLGISVVGGSCEVEAEVEARPKVQMRFCEETRVGMAGDLDEWRSWSS